MEQEFKEGLAHGKRIYYYPNGKIKEEGNYTEGKTTGAWIFNYENGNPQMKCTFVDEKQDGKVESFYEIGTVESVRYYNRGIPTGTWEFYGKREGDLLKKVKYKDGKVVSEK